MFFRVLLFAASLLLPAFALQEPCIEGCCGLLMKLPKASLELHTDVQSPIGAPARKPAVQLPLGNNFIKCCPCDEGQADNAKSQNNTTIGLANAQTIFGANGPVVTVASATSPGMAASHSAPTTIDAAAPSINSENIHTFKLSADTANVPPCTRPDLSICPCGEPGCFRPARVAVSQSAVTTPDAAAPSVNGENIHSYIIPIDGSFIPPCTRDDGSLCPCGSDGCHRLGPLGILIAMPTRASGSDQEHGQQTVAANTATATASAGGNLPPGHFKAEL